MPAISRDPDVERSLKHSLKDATAYAAMTGVGETYVSAFALFMKATAPQIGLLASLPPLLASLAQLFSAWLGRVTGLRKQIVLIGASVQAFAWLPILFLPILFPAYAVPLLIVSVVLYHSGAQFAAPQWSSLMGDIVPERRRGRFFALRTRVVSLTSFCGVMAGGLVLHACNKAGHTLAGFMLLFLTAVVARFISVYHLSRMKDPGGQVAALEAPVGADWWRRLRHSNAVRFSLFFAIMQFGVAIASPFFTVYILRDLGFSYFEFTLNSGSSILAQFLTLSQWGRISDIFGNRRILTVTGLFIPIMPVLWTVSTDVWYLVAVQALTGFSWAGFTLAAGNFVYDLIRPDLRATFLAVHSVLAAIGTFGGAVLGGFLATLLPNEATVFGKHYVWLSPLFGVFVLSTLVRGSAVLFLLPKLREVRSVRPISTSQVIFRVMRINALAGIIFDIVGSRRPRSDESERRS